MLFQLGQLVATQGVDAGENKEEVLSVVLLKHAQGDWGICGDEDKAMNDAAVKSGEDRILSKYTLSSGNDVYVITEWDRSYTTVLYPSEY